MPKEFKNVTLSAEQVTETHRTLNTDHTVTEEELPGMVNVYLDFDGTKVLFTQYKAGKILDAIEQQSKSGSKPADTSK